MENILALDNTKRSSFVTCRRKYYFQYVLNLKTFWGSSALRYGLVWHAGQDAYANHIKLNGWAKDGGAIEAAFHAMKTEWETCSAKEQFWEDYRTLENCFTSFLQYVAHFAQDEMMIKVINTEEAFRINMEHENDEELRLFPNLRPFHFTGKLDTEIELNEQQWINEHKTTGQPIDTQCERLNRSAQVMGYFYAKTRKGNGQRPCGVLMTVHHLSCRKSTAKGREGQYGTPKIDFRRVPQIFSDNDIFQWRMTFLSVALELQKEMERNLWPMCHDSCFEFGACPYLQLCQQATSVDKIDIDESRYYVAEPWEVAKAVTAGEVVY